MNFRVEYVRPQSGRASDEVARGRPFSLEGFSFAFRAKKLRSGVTCNWCLRLHLDGGRNRFNSDRPKIIECVYVPPASIERANLFTLY